MRDAEKCFVCDDETGRAGKGEDSLYDENDLGPYCPRCWGHVPGKVEDLQEELRKARETIEWWVAYVKNLKDRVHSVGCTAIGMETDMRQVLAGDKT